MIMNRMENPPSVMVLLKPDKFTKVCFLFYLFYQFIYGMSVPLEHVHYLAKCIALSLGALSSPLVTWNRSTVTRWCSV